MPDTHYFSLQPSELAIFRAAANIYAGYISASQVSADNEDDMMKKAIAAAISIAEQIEEIIQSDNEMA